MYTKALKYLRYAVSPILKTFISILILIFSIFFIKSIAPSKIYAEVTFTYDISTTYTIHDDFVNTKEVKTITNNTNNRYIPSTEFASFFIPQYDDTDVEKYNEILKSIKTSPSNYITDKVEGGYEIKIPFGKDLTSGKSITFTIEYNDYQLMDIVGNVKNIHFPKIIFPDKNQYEINHSTIVRVPVQPSQNIYYNLTPDQITNDEQYLNLKFNKTQISQNNIYLQLGTQQFFSFKLSQHIPQTYSLKNNIDFKQNNIKLSLPREYEETNQQVYIKSITPEPYNIYTDDEGNIFAEFILSATVEQNIEVEGYILTSLDSNKKIPTFINKEDLAKNDLLTSSALFWESDSEIVMDAIQKIPETDNVIEQIQNIYNYTVETLDYSYEKINDNNRLGAEKALAGYPAVCMEYSDSMIALLRAEGIPARSAFGRGFNSKLSESEQEDHQWVQILIPEYGWITADPTWGENGRIYIGPDLDHVLWYTSEQSPVAISPLSYVIAENVNLESPIIKFTPMSSDISNEIESSTSIDQLISNDNAKDKETVDYYFSNLIINLKTSPLSRIIDQIFPILIGIFSVIVLLLVISVITWLFKKIKKLQIT